MDEEEKQANEGWLDFFRRKGRFGEFILFAWSAIEANIDMALIAEFGLLGKLGQRAGEGVPFDETDEFSKKSKFLLDIPFGRRMDFLSKSGVIKKEEFSVLHEFQRDRNRFFHGREPSFIHLSPDEKDGIMDRGSKATTTSFDIAERSVIVDMIHGTHDNSSN